MVPLTPNWAQSQILDAYIRAHNEQRPFRAITLKARQLGISTLTQALLFLGAWMRENTNSCTVAHEREPSEELFAKQRLFYEQHPFKPLFPHKYSSRRHLTLEVQHSNVWVTTSKNPHSGRSRTITNLHCSEVGFWESPAETMLSLNQAVPHLPGTMILIESTANGSGNFFEDEWIKASNGQTEYEPFFFPWWNEPSYIPCQGYYCRDGSCEDCRAHIGLLGKIDEDERDLVRLGADRAHLAWRRWAIPNKTMGLIDLFHQEYPSTAEEAFLLSGVNAFPEQILKAVYEPTTPAVGRLVRDDTGIGKVKFVPDRNGPLRIYRTPSKDTEWGRYFIGADSCFGTQFGDAAAAQVINRRNREQVAVWHGRINPVAFADELAKLGAFYNQAMIAPEIDGPGLGTIAKLQDIYPNIWHHQNPDKTPDRQRSAISVGWQTTWRRKTWMVTKMADLFERHAVTIHDLQTYKELRGYSFYGPAGESFGPGSSDAHDDLVMALGICLVCESTEPGMEDYEIRPPSSGGIVYADRSGAETEAWS